MKKDRDGTRWLPYEGKEIKGSGALWLPVSEQWHALFPRTRTGSGPLWQALALRALSTPDTCRGEPIASSLGVHQGECGIDSAAAETAGFLVHKEKAAPNLRPIAIDINYRVWQPEKNGHGA